MTTALSDQGSILYAEITHPSGAPVTMYNWTSVQFSRSVGSVVGTCTLEIAYDPRIQYQRFVELPVQLYLQFGMTERYAPYRLFLMTGYVKGIKVVKRAEGPQVQLTCKDKVIDLVECHPITKDPTENMTYTGIPEFAQFFDTTKLTPPQFDGSPANELLYGGNTLRNIARHLCAPFGIESKFDGEWAGKFGSVTQIDETETVFNQLAKLCSQKAVVPHTDGYGRLILGQFVWEGNLNERFSPSPYNQEYNQQAWQETYDEDRLGDSTGYWIDIDADDILEFEQSADFTNRFSAYKVIYNDPSDAGDEDTPETYAWSTDPRFGERWRPKVTRPEKTYKGDKSLYAKYLRQIQRGLSNTIKVTVRYWHKVYPSQGGDRTIRLLEIGKLVRIDYAGIRGVLVIDAVDFSLSGASHRKATLTLRAKDTYAPPPLTGVYTDALDYSYDDGSGIANITDPIRLQFLSEREQGIYGARMNSSNEVTNLTILQDIVNGYDPDDDYE